MLRFLARLFHRQVPWTTEHEWVYDDDNCMKRTCAVCGRHEWLFMRPYPSATEPTLRWKHMYYRDEKK